MAVRSGGELRTALVIEVDVQCTRSVGVSEEHDANDTNQRPHTPTADGSQQGSGCAATGGERRYEAVLRASAAEACLGCGGRRRGLVSHAIAIAVLASALVCGCVGTALGDEAKWQFAPAVAPPPPAKATPAPYGVPLGVVGEISFWSPNRGLLITAGTEEHGGGPVSPGLYAWDGVSWHQLSTVCGGAEGRIVWAGPDEFWTISDQRSGQVVAAAGLGEYEARSLSLCHFALGEVVGSYAMPLEEPESWRHMTGGACFNPSNCWFGGDDGRYPNVGAFHLHWDGSNVSAVYEPEDHSVASMAQFDGSLLEAVQPESSDARLTGESASPAVIHAIGPGATGPFSNLSIVSHATKKLLPEYGQEVRPEALDGFDLAVNAPSGSSANQLWAVANPVSSPPGGKAAGVTVLHDVVGGGGEEGWSQLTPSSQATLLGESHTRFQGSLTLVGERSEWGAAGAIAPEPGSERAWLSLNDDQGTMVALLEASTCEPTKGTAAPCGKVVAKQALPEESEPIGPHGQAGPIDCPAAHDCWMATFSEAGSSGWLFHLTDGAPEEPDNDPLFDGANGVITYRPPDSGVPGVYPDGFSEDDSLANQQVISPPVEQAKVPAAKKAPARTAKQLAKQIKSKLLHHRKLVITFTLTAKAHVQLIARRHRAIVAKTRRETLHPGHHEISVTLNPRRWPTKLQFEVKPVGGAGGASGTSSGGSGSEESGSGDVIGT